MNKYLKSDEVKQTENENCAPQFPTNDDSADPIILPTVQHENDLFSSRPVIDIPKIPDLQPDTSISKQDSNVKDLRAVLDSDSD